MELWNSESSPTQHFFRGFCVHDDEVLLVVDKVNTISRSNVNGASFVTPSPPSMTNRSLSFNQIFMRKYYIQYRIKGIRYQALFGHRNLILGSRPGSQTRGPRAACGPPYAFLRPLNTSKKDKSIKFD